MKKLLFLLAFTMLSNFIFAQTEPPPPLQEQQEIERKEQYQNSTTKLILRNNTNKAIYASLVYYETDESSWTSRGWFKVEPYKSRVMPLGNYTGPLYVHGETQGLLTNTVWGGKWLFCTDPNNAFTILNSDKINCKTKSKFTKLQMIKGENKWTFNP